MANPRVLNDREREIVRENGMDPDRFGVIRREDSAIWLLNYRTRDTVTIRKGDRPW